MPTQKTRTTELGIATTCADLRGVVEAVRRGFVVERVPKARALDWALTAGALQHKSGGFFSVNGVVSDGREKVLIYQPQSAITGIITTIIEGERAFLLQARAEPGCLNEVQFGPTVQSTPANYMRLHGGVATSHIEDFISHKTDVDVLDDTTQLDLGERYLFKSKRSILLETAAPSASSDAFIWASRDAIREAVSESAFLNIDLRSILSVACWNVEAAEGELTPISARVCASLGMPLRPDALGRIFSMLGRPSASNQQARFKPLDQLVNWQEDEWGWSERAKAQGFGVGFYEVSAAHREVKSWVQPLVNSLSEGVVILAARQADGVLEFFVNVVFETGLATRFACAPSFVRYPGGPEELPRWFTSGDTRVLSETTESDEGGRFYRDASAYMIVELNDPDALPAEEGAWMRLSELKMLLRTSNVCTIQLRGVISQLLDARCDD